MRRGALVLLLGAAIGVGSHVLFFRLHQPADPHTLDGQLAWMRQELHLSDEQFARISELHQASSPRLQALAAQVAQMRTEFAAFERARKTTDRVDFIEFAHFVEVRRAINRECLDSTRQLVLASANEMTPRQREQYLGIVSPTDLQNGLPNN
jgi:hypothetical protein